MLTMTSTQTTPNLQGTDPYLAKFERFENEAKQPSWLFPLRKAGIARFAELGFPTTKPEDWRFTNVSPIAKLPFKPDFDLGPESAAGVALNDLTFASLPGPHLVFVNGRFAPGLSTVGSLPNGVKAGSLAAALVSESALLEKQLGRYVG